MGLHGHSNSYAATGSYETTSDDDTSDDSDSNLEPGLDCVAPTRTYKQWRAETSELTSIGSCFDIWWAYESNIRRDYFLTRSSAICLESFLDEDQIRRLQCDHIFHSSCFDQWFFSHDTCPICKSWITAENFTVT